MFGLEEQQVAEAGAILQELALDWRELVAGSEGFLTGEGRRGLWRHEVVWGDMVCSLTEDMHIRASRSGRLTFLFCPVVG